MSYAAYLAYPEGWLPPSGITWRLSALTQIHTSPLDGSTQTLRLPGARWVVSMSWETMPEADWRAIDAFVSWLGGRAGRFTLRPMHAPRRGLGGGAPVIHGGGQTGETLMTRGWPPNQQVLLAGDFLSYPDAAGRPMLHKVATWVVNSGPDGVAGIQISPPIRRPGGDGVALEVNAPFGLFRLASDDEGDLALRQIFASYTLRMEEALY
jgi:hypothetical protein